MKFTLLVSSLLLTLSLGAQTQKGAEIKIKINHYKDSVIYLAHNYGDEKLYIQDTIPVIKGWATIKQDSALEHGMYKIIPQNKRNYFDIVIHNEQHFTLTTDTTDYLNLSKFKNSEQNTLFYEYNQWMNERGKERDSLMKALETAKKENKTDLVKTIEIKNSDLHKKVETHQKTYIKNHPSHLLSKILSMTQDVEFPENLNNDTLKYQYYKSHYWDKMDFSEEGLLRTPLLQAKLTRYLDLVITQDPDSIIIAADVLVEKSKAHPLMFRFILQTITSKYERSQIMCFDGVFVHLVNKYYSKENCPWVNETTLIKMKTRAKSLQYVGCGQVAHDLKLIGLDNKIHQLSKIKSPYTVVWFWDSDCGHCKAQTPKLKKITDVAPFKDSIVVFAVNIENETAGYRKFVKETGLENWINVIDTTFESHFRDYYDIYSTPVMYLLDKDKKIIAKRLDTEGLYDFLLRVWDLKIPQDQRLFKESDPKQEEKEH